MEAPAATLRRDAPQPRGGGANDTGRGRDRKPDQGLYTRPTPARARAIELEAAARPPARNMNAEAFLHRTEGCGPVLANLGRSKITFAKSAKKHLIDGGDGEARLSKDEAEKLVKSASELSHGHSRNDGTPTYVVQYTKEKRMCVAFATADLGMNCKIIHVGPGYD